MPCIVCGKPTKENSIICDSCLQKEIHQKKGATPPPKSKPAAPRRPQPSPPPGKQKPKKKNSSFSFDSLMDDLGDSLSPQDDLEINPQDTPEKPSHKPTPTSEKPAAEDMDLDLDNIFTSSEAEQEAEVHEQTLSTESSDDEVSLDLDSNLSFENGQQPDSDISLDLDQPQEAETPESEAEPEIIEPVDVDPDASDEDILKQKIKNRMQQKLTAMKPVEKKEDPMDSLLDEVLLDEIEETKESVPQPSAPPVQDKTSTPGKNKKPPVPPKKEQPQEEELLNEILKPRKKEKADTSMSISNGIKATEKKKSIAGFEKSKKAAGETPFESSGKIIKGTTTSRKRGGQKEKSSKTWLWVLLILILFSAGGYAVYEFYLKKDPVKIELQQLLDNARHEETQGNLQSAIKIYEKIGPKYARYAEAGSVPLKLRELRQQFEDMKKSSAFQERINNLVTQAREKYEQNQWTDSQDKSALDICNEILKLDAENIDAQNLKKNMEDAYLKSATRHLQRKSYTRAKASFEKVLLINPDNRTASASLSNIQTILEQQRIRQEENRKKQQEQQRLQRQQEQQEQQRQQEAEAQRQAAKRQEEARKAEEERKLQEQQNNTRNQVFIEGLVDGGRRIYVKRVTAELPLSAKRTGIKGTVFIKVIVNNEGVPEEVKIQRSDNEILSNAAMDAIRQYRYKPPTKGGIPCKMELTEIIKFK